MKKKKRIKKDRVISLTFLLIISRLILKIIMASAVNETRHYGYGRLYNPQHDNNTLLTTCYMVNLMVIGLSILCAFSPVELQFSRQHIGTHLV